MHVTTKYNALDDLKKLWPHLTDSEKQEVVEDFLELLGDKAYPVSAHVMYVHPFGDHEWGERNVEAHPGCMARHKFVRDRTDAGDFVPHPGCNAKHKEP